MIAGVAFIVAGILFLVLALDNKLFKPFESCPEAPAQEPVIQISHDLCNARIEALENEQKRLVSANMGIEKERDTIIIDSKKKSKVIDDLKKEIETLKQESRSGVNQERNPVDVPEITKQALGHLQEVVMEYKYYDRSKPEHQRNEDFRQIVQRVEDYLKTNPKINGLEPLDQLK